MSNEPTIKKARVKNAIYNPKTKVMKLHLNLVEEGFNLAMDLPATNFNFDINMDVDEEMLKTAKMMVDKVINVQFDGDINPNG